MIILGLLIFNTLAAPKVSSWKYAPDIIICGDSQVDLQDVEIAVEFWEQRGQKFGDIAYKDNCASYHSGYIKFIGDRNLEDGYFGMTEIYEHGTGHKSIISAYIEISDYETTNLVLLTHELGHAIGYVHCADTLDVMHVNIKKTKVKIRR